MLILLHTLFNILSGALKGCDHSERLTFWTFVNRQLLCIEQNSFSLRRYFLAIPSFHVKMISFSSFLISFRLIFLLSRIEVIGSCVISMSIHDKNDGQIKHNKWYAIYWMGRRVLNTKLHNHCFFIECLKAFFFIIHFDYWSKQPTTKFWSEKNWTR